MIKIRDERTRKLFIQYLEEHPSERFFQAVRNFSGCAFILASGTPPENDMQLDTFYWECDKMLNEPNGEEDGSQEHETDSPQSTQKGTEEDKKGEEDD